MRIQQPSILFIDAYDSFTNNIISLLSTTLQCSIRVIHIDTPGLETNEALSNELRNYDAVVCGPGPGDPLNHADVGLIRRIWKLADDDLLPVLGICLGFQSLAIEHGAGIRKLGRGLHGMIRRIRHCGEDLDINSQNSAGIFEGVGEIQATLYHSLCVGIGQDVHSDDGFEMGKYSMGREIVPDLKPLAWVTDPQGQDKRILMAIQHTSKPFWGLQYHPESICTSSESRKVIQNWFRLAQLWNKQHCRRPLQEAPTIGHRPQRQSLLSKSKRSSSLDGDELNADSIAHYNNYLASTMENHLEYRTIDLPPYVSAENLFHSLHKADDDLNDDQLLFESANANLPHTSGVDVRGRYSILAQDLRNAMRFEYRTGDLYYKVSLPAVRNNGPRTIIPRPFLAGQNIWELLSQFSEERFLKAGNSDAPFWGGFMGYTTYELGLEGINVQGKKGSRQSANEAYRPDLCFSWVSSSIVFDHRAKKIHIQNLTRSKSPTEWLDITTHQVLKILTHLQCPLMSDHIESPKSNQIQDQIQQSTTKRISTCIEPAIVSQYESKVSQCQEYIADGNSYELCLTDQTHIAYKLSSNNSTGTHVGRENSAPFEDSWSIYRTLRARQPAPMASYIRLGGATFVSASPERFLKWDENGRCELRPMKGTVKKSDKVNTLAQAEKLLQVPKEQAENLMIVDLVRHDLHGVCGAGNVTVPKLMVVEEYANVFQMITVVKGQIPQIDDRLSVEAKAEARETRYTGIDVLAASLPPGSMTGAPKKRSCEILQEVENGYDRSLYSGVVGYIDVGGRGDFSVNIRCLFGWEDERVKPGQGSIKDRIHRRKENGVQCDEAWPRVWHVGAGGAVTALSTPVGEREEMQTKAGGTLAIFTDQQGA